jgi:hypothetical protein
LALSIWFCEEGVVGSFSEAIKSNNFLNITTYF